MWAAPITQVTFKNCAPFITKIDGTTIEDAEDLDLVRLMYNLVEYGLNRPDTASILKPKGFILKMKQLILMLVLLTMIILNLSIIIIGKYSCRWSEWNSEKCNNCCAIIMCK